MKNWIILVITLFTPAIGLCQKHYELNLKKETSITAISLGFLATSYIIDERSSTTTFQEISQLDKMNVSRFDRTAIANYSDQADKLSDLFLYSSNLAPLSLLFSSYARNERFECISMFAEVVALNGGITTFVKSSTSRFRPYVYNIDVPSEEKLKLDARRSFFSGHTSHTAAVSFYAASVFSEYHPNSKYKYLVWTGAALIPAITGYLRYESGNHFPTDIVTGYCVGAAIGYFIPALHKTKMKNNLTIFGSSKSMFLVYQF